MKKPNRVRQGGRVFLRNGDSFTGLAGRRSLANYRAEGERRTTAKNTAAAKDQHSAEKL